MLVEPALTRDRWWAVAIPSLATIALIYIYAALQGYNQAITPSLDRLECITGTTPWNFRR